MLPNDINVRLVRESERWLCTLVWRDLLCEDNVPSNNSEPIPGVHAIDIVTHEYLTFYWNPAWGGVIEAAVADPLGEPPAWYQPGNKFRPTDEGAFWEDAASLVVFYSDPEDEPNACSVCGDPWFHRHTVQEAIGYARHCHDPRAYEG